MEEKKLVIDGKRVDGRTPDEMRSVRIEAGILEAADGSAYIEWGGNKILAGVYGPRECIPRFLANPYRALVKCRYMMSPFASAEEHGRSGPSRRSNELSKVIKEVFQNVIIAEKYPNTQIDIYLDVLQAEGGTRTASITAAAVALANAGIPMKDMVGAISGGKADDEILLDLGKAEDNLGQSDVPIALAHKSKDILLLQMDGLLTKDEIEKMLSMIETAEDTIHSIQADALRRLYEKPGETEFRM